MFMQPATQPIETPETHLLERLAPLGEPLHKSLSRAAEKAAEIRDYNDLAEDKYRWAGTHLARALAHRQLDLQDDLGGWSLAGSQVANGALWLRNKGTMIRVLHSDTSIPAPGSNERRRAYFCNQPMLRMPEFDQLLSDDSSSYLAIWHVTDQASHAVAVRMVRPIGVWKFGGRTKVDLDFWLPNDREDFSRLEFTPDDDDLHIRLPGDDTGELDARG